MQQGFRKQQEYSRPQRHLSTLSTLGVCLYACTTNDAALIQCSVPGCGRYAAPLKNFPAAWEFRDPADSSKFLKRATDCPHLSATMAIGWANATLAHVHIPKTGGTAIRKANIRQTNGCHVTSRQIRAKQTAAEQVYTEATQARSSHHGAMLFATVRHPLDRFISQFHHLWMNPGPEQNIAFRTSGVRPTDADMVSKARQLLASYRRGNMPWWWSPQVRWLLDDDRKMNVNFLLQFESFTSDYAQLAIMSDLKPLGKDKIRAHPHPHWCQLINTTLATIVEELYDADFNCLSLLYQPRTCIV